MIIERKNIDEMTKSELKAELDELRDEYKMLKLKSDISAICDRFVTSMELQKVKDYAEKVYEQEVVEHWGFWYGVRDNIHDMADKMAELQDFDNLHYFNAFMYGMLLSDNPSATEGLHTMTDDMKKILLKHLLEEKKEGVA